MLRCEETQVNLFADPYCFFAGVATATNLPSITANSTRSVSIFKYGLPLLAQAFCASISEANGLPMDAMVPSGETDPS